MSIPKTLAAFLVLSHVGLAAEYVVLTSVADDDPYYAAAQRLAKHHRTKHVLRFDPARPEGVLPKLQQLEPRYVAIVMRPEEIHINSVRAMLKMSAQVDGDPFVDFEYGFITGATAEEASAFVENIIKASKGRKHPRRVGEAGVWGGTRPCSAEDGTYRVGSLSFPKRHLIFADPDGKHGRDQEFIDEELDSLNGCGAIIMGGHGMPWEISSGPRAEDLGGLELFPAVAFNYACHTGVTRTWSDLQYGGGGATRKLQDIEAKKSFALAMIRSGITGYVAYVNPRPAGPELSIDFERVLAGHTLGAARRNDYHKVVMGYLGFDEPGITVPIVEDGATVSRDQLDAVRNLMLEGATGGILFGDPSFRPYPEASEALPLQVDTKVKGKELHVTVRLPGQMAYLWGADPFRRFDDETRTMAMKLYARVELPKKVKEVRSAQIVSAKWGGRPIQTLPEIWALEEDQGKRYVNLKANFARGGSGNVEVRWIVGPKEAPVRQKTPQTKPKNDPAKEPAESTLAERVNTAALEASHDLDEDVEKLRQDENAYADLCNLIARGKGHWRTHLLVKAVWKPGGEKRMLKLAAGPALPNYGSWIALESLGCMDTTEVRRFLLNRLEKEKDSGLFMSAAKAAATLREKKAAKLIADQLLRFETGWSGVEPHLIMTLRILDPARANEVTKQIEKRRKQR